MALGLGQQQMAQAATLEHLRERLERAAGGEGPDRKIARLAEEQQQRLIQQAFQQNLLAMASHFNPVKQPAAANNDHGQYPAMVQRNAAPNGDGNWSGCDAGY